MQAAAELEAVTSRGMGGAAARLHSALEDSQRLLHDAERERDELSTQLESSRLAARRQAMQWDAERTRFTNDMASEQRRSRAFKSELDDAREEVGCLCWR